MTRSKLGPLSTYAVVVGGLLLMGFFPISKSATQVTLGSKKFSESVILGELLTHLARSTGLTAKHLQEIWRNANRFWCVEKRRDRCLR